jgi:acylglycerol lipase
MPDNSQNTKGTIAGDVAVMEAETTLPVQDGITIFARAWAPARPQRVVVCVQGLGGHGGYYRDLAGYLVLEGTAVVAPDLRGHGRSEGVRGTIDRFDRYLEDVAAALRWARACWPEKPLILLGESMGSSIALHYVARAQQHMGAAAMAGLALVSPVLSAVVHPSLGEIARYLRLLFTAPSRAAIPVTGREELGCRDPAFNDRLRADPLFVRQVSVRFLNSLARWLRQTRRLAAHINLPLLVLQGEADYIARRRATAAFFRQVATTDRQLVTFPEAYHCLLYDPATPLVIQALTAWLAARG